MKNWCLMPWIYQGNFLRGIDNCSCPPWVLYMSFDKFLLAVESRDLSQADRAIIRVSSFPKLFLNNKIYSYTKKTYLALGNLAIDVLVNSKI